jgi:ABC-type methionine transport system ATPase subunit
MSIEFRDIEYAPLDRVTVSAPDGAIIGITGVKGSGKAALLRLAAGVERPARGAVIAGESRRLIRLGEALNFSPVDVLALDGALACQDPLVKARACVSLERLRRGGATILLSSYDEPLMKRICDEVWWLNDGRLECKGDAREVLAKFNAFVAERFAAWGRSLSEPIDLTQRRGDGRAEIIDIETLNAAGDRTVIWKSGDRVAIRVIVHFREAVDDPVIGIMIRTRVGFEVYGTNTEVERAEIGRCEAGQILRVLFGFRCDLCPGDYTVTAASHDRDGTAHDWLDDAVAFSVTDERSTAGVANLRATVAVERAL